VPFTYTYGTLKGEWKNDYFNQLVKDLKATLGTIEGKSEDQIDPADRWFLSSGDAIKFNRGTWGTSPTVPGAGQDIHSAGGDIHNFKWASGYNQPFDAKRTVHIATGYGMVGDGLESSATANMNAMQTALSTISTYGVDTGAVLFFPPGVYIFDTVAYRPIIDINPSHATYPISHLTIMGCGPATTIKLSKDCIYNMMIRINGGASLHISNLMLHGNCMTEGTIGAATGYSKGIFIKDGELRCHNVTLKECGDGSIYVFSESNSDITFLDVQNCRFLKTPQQSIWVYNSDGGQTSDLDGFRLSGNRLEGGRDAGDWIADWPSYNGGDYVEQQIRVQMGRMISCSKNLGVATGQATQSRLLQVDRSTRYPDLHTDMVNFRSNMFLDQDDFHATEMLRVCLSNDGTTAQPMGGILAAANMCEALSSFTQADPLIYWNAHMIIIRGAGSMVSGGVTMHYIIVYGNLSGPAESAFFCGSRSTWSVGANHVGIIANLSFRAEPNTNPSNTKSYCTVFEGHSTGSTIMKYGIILGNVYGDSRATADRSERAFSLRNQYVEYCSMLANIGKDTQYAGIWDSASKYSDVSHNIGGFDRDA
jgi:hypothetical protein